MQILYVLSGEDALTIAPKYRLDLKREAATTTHDLAPDDAMRLDDHARARVQLVIERHHDHRGWWLRPQGHTGVGFLGTLYATLEEVEVAMHGL